MLRRSGRLGVLGLLAVVAALAWSIAHGTLGAQFERWVADFQRAVSGWYIASPASLDGARLYAIAFVGGLAASISPCILGMLPVNLAYVGAARTRTRAGAVLVATQFVAGVIVVTAAVGLFASLFFAFFVTYRGQVNIGVGALMVVMGFMAFRRPADSASQRDCDHSDRGRTVRRRPCVRAGRVALRESDPNCRTRENVGRGFTAANRRRDDRLCDRLHRGSVVGVGLRRRRRGFAPSAGVRRIDHANRGGGIADDRHRYGRLWSAATVEVSECTNAH